jgi:hypothetical protein
VRRDDPERIKKRFEYVHDILVKILAVSGKSFAQLLFKAAKQRLPRYYETTFLSLYALLIRENREFVDLTDVARALDGIGDRVFHITGGGGTWSAENKRSNIAAVSDKLRDLTVPVTHPRDLMLEANEARVHQLLNAALAEHSLFEIKQGLHTLDVAGEFNVRSFERILQTMSAIANEGKDSVGYLMIGVADDLQDARCIHRLSGLEVIKEREFYIVGVDREFDRHEGTLDGYLLFLTAKLRDSKLEPDLVSNILREMRPVKVSGRTIILMPIRSLQQPVTYQDKWYERQGSSTVEVSPRDVGRLFERFQERADGFRRV